MTVLLGACALAPAAAGLFSHRDGSGTAVASAGGLVAHALVMAIASVIYLHWRSTGSDVAGWLVTALVTISVPGLLLATLLAGADPTTGSERRSWHLVAHLLVTLALLAVVLAASRFSLPGDPLRTGLLAGGAVSLICLWLVLGGPDLGLSEHARDTLAVLPPLVMAAVAAVIVVRGRSPRWVRVRLAAGFALLMTGQSLAAADPSSVWSGTVGLVATVSGAGLLCATSLGLLRLSAHQRRVEVTALYDRLAGVESAARRDRARLHQIGSTVAGLASASRLIHEPSVLSVLSERRRSALEELMQAEMHRLERLMQDDDRPLTHDFDLDDVLDQLVVREQARGRSVSWSPSGHAVAARADDVAEIVGVLLDNAARHAGDVGTTLDVRSRDGAVEILVSDDGPGPDPEVRARMFDWGFRGPDSDGQGIGLHFAHELAERQGGYLHLEPGPVTVFVLGLLAASPQDARRTRAS